MPADGTIVQGFALNILIVDDDEVHGRSVRELLAAHKYSAEVATQGTEGLERLLAAQARGTPFEVLILDLNIPDLHGVEILRRAEAAGIETKVVVLSGEDHLQLVAPLLKHGAFDFVPKPFDANQLINSVANALARFRLEREVAAMHRQVTQNAELYGFLLNASPDFIYMLDAEGKFKYLNTKLEDLFDCSLDDVVGKPWHVLFADHPDLVATLQHQMVERRSRERATQGFEFDYTSELGTHHTLELSAIGLYETTPSTDDTATQLSSNDAAAAETFVGTYGVLRDVTESKRTQRELRQNQQKFYSLFVDSPDAIFIARLDTGQLLERNPRFIALRQKFPASDDGTDSFLWTERKPRDAFVAELERSPESLAWHISHTLNDQPEHFEIHARLLEIENQPCMLATLRDRTAERRAENDRLRLQKQLEQASRMEAIGQIAGGIAHDFNNILASMIGYAELVMNARTRLESEQVDQYLDEVVTAGHRARDLISQMLTFTRAKRGVPKATNLESVIGDVSRMLRAAIPSTIDISTEFDANLPEITIDPVQLQQIIINLLINARDAIDGHGTIAVHGRRAAHTANDADATICRTCGDHIGQEMVQISVADTGHGIPTELQNKIFDMYFTTREPDKGTGFGLWLINTLVHEHHGHLTLHSTPGSGTTFNIFLPVATRSDVADFPQERGAPTLNGRIVVVDDEVSVANFIGEVLRDRGYPTVVFTDSLQAKDYLDSHLDSVELLLTDGTMPSLSGVELARHIRSVAPQIPIVFITGFTQRHSAAELERLGVKHYLQKPFSINEMMETVESLVQVEEQAPQSKTG